MSLEELKSEGHLRGPLVDPDDFCIDWYRLGKDGYAVNYDERIKKKIRLCRILTDAPRDLTVDHLCRNKACIRIDHLELVPLKENMRRSRVFHHTDTCRVCGSREFFHGKQCRYCAVCNRKRTRKYFEEIYSDPSKFAAYIKGRRGKYQEDKDRINARRRENRRQAKSA